MQARPHSCAFIIALSVVTIPAMSPLVRAASPGAPLRHAHGACALVDDLLQEVPIDGSRGVY
jgi:hypothetical protein